MKSRKPPFALLIFLLLVSFSSNSQVLDTVAFSYPAGFYSDSIFVTITSPDAGATIYYTLNGNEPTQSSLVYTSPVLIKNKAGVANSYSLIPTNPGFTYPINGYDAFKADTRGWLPPYSEVNKATVLKAKAFQIGHTPSVTKVSTYFINPLLSSRYSFSVLSISTDSSNLFSDSTGIYVYGLDTIDGGNYKDDVEQPMTLELFETNGTLALSQRCGVTGHGGGGRTAPQKSFKVSGRAPLGPNTFHYHFFPDKGTGEYKNFLIRNGGHRPDCFSRDDLAGKIIQNMNLEVQHQRKVISFINGEYWGIQTLKDNLDEHYLQHKYSVSDLDVAILKYDNQIEVGVASDTQHYANMLNYTIANNMALVNNYNYINTQMDVLNYVDYQATEIYFGNGDWPENNIKYWRKRIPTFNPLAGVNLDGRWRWIFYDMDAGFGADCSGIYYSHNSVFDATEVANGVNTILLRSLLISPEFKNLFINRNADLLNTEFLKTRVDAIATVANAEITPEVMEHVTRWRYPVISSTLATRATEVPSLSKWNLIKSGLHTFAVRRPAKVRQHMMGYFALADTVDITVNVSDTAAGRIKISTLIIDNNTVGLTGTPYPWSGKYFTTIPIPLKALPRPGYHFVEWLGTAMTTADTIVYPTTDTSYTAVFAADSVFVPYHLIYINELSAANSIVIGDEYGQYNDWFEFYNPNNFDVDVDNYYVSDSLNYRQKYRFASGYANTIIPAHGFKLLWADGQPEQGVLHTNFQFASLTGEALILLLPDGQTVVDSVIFGPQVSNFSWGRATDGNPSWISFYPPTPGYSNNSTVDVNSNYYENNLPFAVYPNPAQATDKIFFNKVSNVSIYNCLGELQMQSDAVTLMNITNLAKGVYFVKTDKGEIVKFIRL